MRKKALFNSVKSLSLAAMLVAMSVVIGIFCKTVLNFGNGLFRITFENLPIILSGVVFGPAVGCVVGISSDLISYLLSGQTYPPNLLVTLGAALIGLISGFVSKFLIKKRGNAQFALAGILSHVVGSMIIKPIGLYAFYGWAVLWRIPMYLAIAPIEIFILCLLYRNGGFHRLITDIDKENI